MSNVTQCPSTVGKRDGVGEDALPVLNGRSLWRSLDELAGTSEFREFLHREFPAFASELSDPSRRGFLRMMGASLALAGAATIPGCRRPEHRIMPYGKQPEDVVLGKPLFYATAMPLPGGGAEGLLVETHEGRPTKIEGNPLHPGNQGRSSIFAQASILNLYDPDRLQHPTRMGDSQRIDATWEEFERFARGHFASFDQKQGAGLVFLVAKTTSLTRDQLRDAALARWPLAKWLPYEPVDDESAREGARMAFGKPFRTNLDLAKAKVIVSIDRDFLSGEGATLSEARGFASGRRVFETHGAGSEMSRIYAVESTMTLTGGAADHRLRLKPSQIPAYVIALAKAVFERVGGSAASGPVAQTIKDNADQSALSGVDPEWIDAVADDLVKYRAAAVVTIGPAQPAGAHALVHAINAALGSLGTTAHLRPLTGDAAASSLDSIRQVAQLINSGRIDTLIAIGVNPVYDAPVDLGLHEIWAKIPTSITLSVDDHETGVLSTWQLNGAHTLEAWGDVAAMEDGALSVVQPMIAPLFGGRSEIELIATLLERDSPDGHEMVRAAWRAAAPGMKNLDDAAFEKRWNRALHNGFLDGSATSHASPGLDSGAIAQAISALSPAANTTGFEVVFMADRTLYDGRWANNGWLQELPDPLSKSTWDNPAMISAATAKKLAVVEGDLVDLELEGRTIRIPVYRQPGMADDTVLLTFGGGRERTGRIGKGVGFNTFRVRTTGAMRLASGAAITRVGSRHEIAGVQSHWAMEGRSLIREFDVQAWRDLGDEIVQHEDPYGAEKEVKFAERAGEMAHTPSNRNIYKPNQEHRFTASPQWGMSIDLGTCSGCGACTIACQAENNIPVVGRKEVAQGREMHWIRIDRYYASGDPGHSDKFSNDYGDAGPYTGGRKHDEVGMIVQPVPCMHCEQAPCETVCPVNATVTDSEGTNNMVYNRCIGTRYCANNCPYKVRRFNFFDYATMRLHGDYKGKKLLGEFAPDEQLVPPLLREKIQAGAGVIQTMQYNPNVTVRVRGVMEKCSYCVQRINAARVQTQLEKLDTIPDGYFQTACQQACPTESIVFGDISDPLSKVRKLRDHARSYLLLGYLNTRPRTTYLARLRNPNPRLREPIMAPFHHAEGTTETGGEHGASSDPGHVMSLPILLPEGMSA